jgi:hypothetical protein
LDVLGDLGNLFSLPAIQLHITLIKATDMLTQSGYILQSLLCDVKDHDTGTPHAPNNLLLAFRLKPRLHYAQFLERHG